ncbi:forkhead-associated domain-containing protein 1 isoform X1 [Nematostella vectensis]|uniref:forkhead-associated domain-containing protein 1 isoform X1 n=1 Tax=Nematostella vectensis TaxID=45351 RepID=UPI0020770945|nr:forkhead-associated domain-containing protein 1 isoform X1 [Nematostella vectensis]
MKAQLRSKDGGSVYQLRYPVTTVGREGNDIVLQFPSIERQHARLMYDEGQGCYVLEDLNSGHGTYVNEMRVQNAAVRLAPGDVIRFGYDNPGYELNLDQVPLIHYPVVNSTSRPWLRMMSSPAERSSLLPYISTGLSTLVDNPPLYQSSQGFSLPTSSYSPGNREMQENRGGNVLPHPPLRSRPASAGSTRSRPAQTVRGAWDDGSFMGRAVNGDNSTMEDLQERLLRMGDELSRLAAYEAECHRKDGVIQSLRDEMAELKSRENPAFRGGGEFSAFTSTGLAELQQKVNELQARLKEKEEAHRTVTQKLSEYQSQMHIKNEEIASLKDQLDSKPPARPTPYEDSNNRTNNLASLRTEMAEKDRKIAHLTQDLAKANKAKTQTATLMNTLQRENSAKDGMIQQLKTEVDKQKKQLKEKEATISTLSAKLTRQKAIKEAEVEAERREKDLLSSMGKLQTTEKQLKDRTRQIAELQGELERAKQALSEERQRSSSSGNRVAHLADMMIDEADWEVINTTQEDCSGDATRGYRYSDVTPGYRYNGVTQRDRYNGFTQEDSFESRSSNVLHRDYSNQVALGNESCFDVTLEERHPSPAILSPTQLIEKITPVRNAGDGPELGRTSSVSPTGRSQCSLDAVLALLDTYTANDHLQDPAPLPSNSRRDREVESIPLSSNKAEANRHKVKMSSAATQTEQSKLGRGIGDVATTEEVYSLTMAFLKSDRAIQQELDHAKAQFLDANRAEKLLKVDYQQLERRFDRFRRKVIQNVFINKKIPDCGEMDDEELLDSIKELSHDTVRLTDEIRGYADAEERLHNEKNDLKDAVGVLRKTLEGIERRLSRSGRSFRSLEKELTELEEVTTHDSLHWIKEVICRLLSNEMSWQKRAEDTIRRAGVDSEGSDSEESPSVETLCRKLQSQRDQCRRLEAKITEMEETHQDVILKLREDAKREEDRQVSRAVAEARSEQEEKFREVVEEMRVKEQDRIRQAVETERRIMESQHGSVTQLQQTLSEKNKELEQYRSALSSAKSQYEQARDELQRVKESESHLCAELESIESAHRVQVERLEREKEEFKNYKQEEVASFKEQTRQHALTIVAMEDRLLRLTKQNKQLEQEVAFSKQQSGAKHRPTSPRKESRPPSPRKTSPRPQSPKKEPKQTRSVETETSPQSNVEASLKSDVYKLEQLVLLLRREASQAKKEAQDQSDVVQGLRRDLAGASARMSDLAGELSDKQKQKLEEYEERIQLQDKELEGQREQLLKLSTLVDEQQKEIDMREGRLSETEKSLVKHKQDIKKKGTELVKYREKLVETMEDRQTKVDEIEIEKKTASDLYAQGLRCRGERHEHVIARQKEALADMRKKSKLIEQLKPPLPSHEQSLQQIVALKQEIAELRATLASREEDFHKNESQIHAELRLVREQSSSNLAEKQFEKSTHKDTKDALDLSEKTYLKLARTLGALLEVDPVPGTRSMAHIPAEEREKLEQDRSKAVELLVSRVKLLQERLDRKENLLGGYEKDLVNLRESQTVAGMKSAEASGLKLDVRTRQEEIAYLRESLSRLRDELDQERRVNVCLRERKKFAMDFEDRDTHRKAHSCYTDEHSRYQEEAKKRKAAERIKRKNYEIESLKKELRSADRELNDTAIRLQAFESTRNMNGTDSDVSDILYHV